MEDPSGEDSGRLGQNHDPAGEPDDLDDLSPKFSKFVTEQQIPALMENHDALRRVLESMYAECRHVLRRSMQHTLDDWDYKSFRNNCAVPDWEYYLHPQQRVFSGASFPDREEFFRDASCKALFKPMSTPYFPPCQSIDEKKGCLFSRYLESSRRYASLQVAGNDMIQRYSEHEAMPNNTILLVFHMQGFHIHGFYRFLQTPNEKAGHYLLQDITTGYLVKVNVFGVADWKTDQIRNFEYNSCKTLYFCERRLKHRGVMVHGPPDIKRGRTPREPSIISYPDTPSNEVPAPFVKRSTTQKNSTAPAGKSKTELDSERMGAKLLNRIKDGAIKPVCQETVNGKRYKVFDHAQLQEAAAQRRARLPPKFVPYRPTQPQQQPQPQVQPSVVRTKKIVRLVPLSAATGENRPRQLIKPHPQPVAAPPKLPVRRVQVQPNRLQPEESPNVNSLPSTSTALSQPPPKSKSNQPVDDENIVVDVESTEDLPPLIVEPQPVPSDAKESIPPPSAAAGDKENIVSEAVKTVVARDHDYGVPRENSDEKPVFSSLADGDVNDAFDAGGDSEFVADTYQSTSSPYSQQYSLTSSYEDVNGLARRKMSGVEKAALVIPSIAGRKRKMAGSDDGQLDAANYTTPVRKLVNPIRSRLDAQDAAMSGQTSSKMLPRVHFNESLFEEPVKRGPGRPKKRIKSRSAPQRREEIVDSGIATPEIVWPCPSRPKESPSWKQPPSGRARCKVEPIPYISPCQKKVQSSSASENAVFTPLAFYNPDRPSISFADMVSPEKSTTPIVPRVSRNAKPFGDETSMPPPASIPSRKRKAASPELRKEFEYEQEADEFGGEDYTGDDICMEPSAEVVTMSEPLIEHVQQLEVTETTPTPVPPEPATTSETTMLAQHDVKPATSLIEQPLEADATSATIRSAEQLPAVPVETMDDHPAAIEELKPTTVPSAELIVPRQAEDFIASPQVTLLPIPTLDPISKERATPDEVQHLVRTLESWRDELRSTNSTPDSCISTASAKAPLAEVAGHHPIFETSLFVHPVAPTLPDGCDMPEDFLADDDDLAMPITMPSAAIQQQPQPPPIVKEKKVATRSDSDKRNAVRRKQFPICAEAVILFPCESSAELRQTVVARNEASPTFLHSSLVETDTQTKPMQCSSAGFTVATRNEAEPTLMRSTPERMGVQTKPSPSSTADYTVPTKNEAQPSILRSSPENTDVQTKALPTSSAGYTVASQTEAVHSVLRSSPENREMHTKPLQSSITCSTVVAKNEADPQFLCSSDEIVDMLSKPLQSSSARCILSVERSKDAALIQSSAVSCTTVKHLLPTSSILHTVSTGRNSMSAMLSSRVAATSTSRVKRFDALTSEHTVSIDRRVKNIASHYFLEDVFSVSQQLPCSSAMFTITNDRCVTEAILRTSNTEESTLLQKLHKSIDSAEHTIDVGRRTKSAGILSCSAGQWKDSRRTLPIGSAQLTVTKDRLADSAIVSMSQPSWQQSFKPIPPMSTEITISGTRSKQSSHIGEVSTKNMALLWKFPVSSSSFTIQSERAVELASVSTVPSTTTTLRRPVSKLCTEHVSHIERFCQEAFVQARSSKEVSLAKKRPSPRCHYTVPTVRRYAARFTIGSVVSRKAKLIVPMPRKDVVHNFGAKTSHAVFAWISRSISRENRLLRFSNMGTHETREECLRFRSKLSLTTHLRVLKAQAPFTVVKAMTFTLPVSRFFSNYLSVKAIHRTVLKKNVSKAERTETIVGIPLLRQFLTKIPEPDKVKKKRGRPRKIQKAASPEPISTDKEPLEVDHSQSYLSTADAYERMTCEQFEAQFDRDAFYYSTPPGIELVPEDYDQPATVPMFHPATDESKIRRHESEIRHDRAIKTAIQRIATAKRLQECDDAILRISTKLALEDAEAARSKKSRECSRGGSAPEVASSSKQLPSLDLRFRGYAEMGSRLAANRSYEVDAYEDSSLRRDTDFAQNQLSAALPRREPDTSVQEDDDQLRSELEMSNPNSQINMNQTGPSSNQMYGMNSMELSHPQYPTMPSEVHHYQMTPSHQGFAPSVYGMYQQQAANVQMRLPHQQYAYHHAQQQQQQHIVHDELPGDLKEVHVTRWIEEIESRAHMDAGPAHPYLSSDSHRQNQGHHGLHLAASTSQFPPTAVAPSRHDPSPRVEPVRDGSAVSVTVEECGVVDFLNISNESQKFAGASESQAAARQTARNPALGQAKAVLKDMPEVLRKAWPTPEEDMIESGLLPRPNNPLGFPLPFCYPSITNNSLPYNSDSSKNTRRNAREVAVKPPARKKEKKKKVSSGPEHNMWLTDPELLPPGHPLYRRMSIVNSFTQSRTLIFDPEIETILKVTFLGKEYFGNRSGPYRLPAPGAHIVTHDSEWVLYTNPFEGIFSQVFHDSFYDFYCDELYDVCYPPGTSLNRFADNEADDSGGGGDDGGNFFHPNGPQFGNQGFGAFSTRWQNGAQQGHNEFNGFVYNTPGGPMYFSRELWKPSILLKIPTVVSPERPLSLRYRNAEPDGRGVLQQFKEFGDQLSFIKKLFEEFITSLALEWRHLKRSEDRQLVEAQLLHCRIWMHNWEFCGLLAQAAIFTPVQCLLWDSNSEVQTAHMRDVAFSLWAAWPRIFNPSISSWIIDTDRRIRGAVSDARYQRRSRLGYAGQVLSNVFMPDALVKSLQSTSPMWDHRARAYLSSTPIAQIPIKSSFPDLDSVFMGKSSVASKVHVEAMVGVLLNDHPSAADAVQSNVERIAKRGGHLPRLGSSQYFNAMVASGILRDIGEESSIDPTLCAEEILSTNMDLARLEPIASRFSIARYITMRTNYLKSRVVAEAERTIQEANAFFRRTLQVPPVPMIDGVQIVFCTDLRSFGAQVNALPNSVPIRKMERPPIYQPMEIDEQMCCTSSSSLPSLPSLSSLRGKKMSAVTTYSDSNSSAPLPAVTTLLRPLNQFDVASLMSVDSGISVASSSSLPSIPSQPPPAAKMTSSTSLSLSRLNVEVSFADRASELRPHPPTVQKTVAPQCLRSRTSPIELPLPVVSTISHVEKTVECASLPILPETRTADSTEAHMATPELEQSSPNDMSEVVKTLLAASDIVEGGSRANSVDRESPSILPSVDIPPTQSNKRMVTEEFFDGSSKYDCQIDFDNSEVTVSKLTVDDRKGNVPTMSQNVIAYQVTQLLSNGKTTFDLIVKDGSIDWESMVRAEKQISQSSAVNRCDGEAGASTSSLDVAASSSESVALEVELTGTKMNAVLSRTRHVPPIPTSVPPKKKSVASKIIVKPEWSRRSFRQMPCTPRATYARRQTERYTQIYLTEPEEMVAPEDREGTHSYMSWVEQAVHAAERERRRMMESTKCDSAFRSRILEERRETVPTVHRRSKSAEGWFGRSICKHFGEYWPLGLARMDYEKKFGVPNHAVNAVSLRPNVDEPYISRCNTPASISPWDEDRTADSDTPGEPPQVHTLLMDLKPSLEPKRRKKYIHIRAGPSRPRSPRGNFPSEISPSLEISDRIPEPSQIARMDFPFVPPPTQDEQSFSVPLTNETPEDVRFRVPFPPKHRRPE